MNPYSKTIQTIVRSVLLLCFALYNTVILPAQTCDTKTNEVVQTIIQSTVLLMSEKVYYDNPLISDSGLITAFEDVNENNNSISSDVFGAQQQTNLGSGVLFKKNSVDSTTKYYVITNAHVIKDFTAIWVVLSDDTFFEATLEGVDETIDIAIVSFSTQKNLPLISIGDSNTIAMGESVYALGNPLGVSFTVTKGIISHVNRYTEYRSDTIFSGPYLQTDAAVNQGNSGGVLVNTCGDAIGITTFIISGNNRNNIGLNFALPMNIVMQSVANILQHKEYEFGWIGIVVNDYNLDIRKELGITTRAGIFVQNVFFNSPAYKAGIRPGHFLKKIDGTPIVTRDNYSSIFSTISKKNVGQNIRLNVQNLHNESHNILEMNIQIEKRPNNITSKQYRMKLWPGMAVKPLQNYEKELYGVPDEKSGIFVLKVFKDTAADISGIKAYDLILKINDTIVHSWKDYANAFTNTDAKNITVMRMGKHVNIFFKEANKLF